MSNAPPNFDFRLEYTTLRFALENLLKKAKDNPEMSVTAAYEIDWLEKVLARVPIDSYYKQGQWSF